jgi:hypothetical protein
MTIRYPSQTLDYRRRQRDRYQAISARTARRHGEAWTAWDDYVLLYGAGTLLERAQEIERTYHAAVLRRQNLLDAIRRDLSASESRDLVT